jgi:hypothetical protein
MGSCPRSGVADVSRGPAVLPKGAVLLAVPADFLQAEQGAEAIGGPEARSPAMAFMSRAGTPALSLDHTRFRNEPCLLQKGRSDGFVAKRILIAQSRPQSTEFGVTWERASRLGAADENPPREHAHFQYLYR